MPKPEPILTAERPSAPPPASQPAASQPPDGCTDSGFDPAGLELQQDKALQQTVIFMARVGIVGSVLLSVILSVRAQPTSFVVTAGMTSLLCALVWGWSARGGHRKALYVLLAVCLAVASTAVVLFGSLRVSHAYLYISAVVLAGALLERRVLVLTLVAAVLASGVLTWMEMRGLLGPRPRLEVDYQYALTMALHWLFTAAALFYNRWAQQQTFCSYRSVVQARIKTQVDYARATTSFHHVFRLAPMPLLVHSPENGEIVDVNPAFERALGYVGANRAYGRPVKALWVNPMAWRRHLRGLRHQPSTAWSNLIIRTADGRLLPAEVCSQHDFDGVERLVISFIHLPPPSPPQSPQPPQLPGASSAGGLPRPGQLEGTDASP